MKVLIFIYNIEENESKIKIFNPNFVDEYKNKCKINYKNKIYSLQSEFKFVDKNIKKPKIKLICFINFSNIDYMIKGCQSFQECFQSKKFIINNNKYCPNLNFVLYDKLKMIYQKKPKAKEIKIF